jgi:hypothetical protein
MSALWQEVLVALLVAASALFSAWRLASVRARLRALEALAALPGLRTVSWLATIRRRTLEGFGSGCSGCAQATGETRSRTRVNDLSSSP